MLRFAETMSTLGEMALDTYPWQAELPYDEASGLYVLRDETRCFEVYDAQDNLVVLIMGNDDDPLIEMHDYVERNSLDYMVDWLFDYGETGITTSVGMLDEPIALSDPNSAEEVWRQAYASMALAYDYFYHVLGWDGFNAARQNRNRVQHRWRIMGNDIKGDNAAMLPAPRRASWSTWAKWGASLRPNPTQRCMNTPTAWNIPSAASWRIPRQRAPA